MTARKPRDPDAITVAEAALMLNLSEDQVARLRQDGLLIRFDRYPSYSRIDVQEFIDNPWLNGRQAASLLGVNHTCVSQLADAEKISVHHTNNGRRVYRQRQLEVVARARLVKFRDAAL